MKKIYWCVQQLNKVGGTEEVSIDLMNHLADKYDITLISTSEIEKDIVFSINPSIKTMSLNMPSEVARFDQYFALYFKKFHWIKLMKLLWETINSTFFKRHKIRKHLASLLKEDDSLMICSALDSYWYAPKKGKVYFHFHFNSKVFFSLGNKLILLLSRKPDKYIFLSKSTLDIVTKKKPKIASKATYVYNPIRFAPELDLSYHDNTIIFAGRFAYQKNPLLALKVANALKEDNFPFKMKMFGQGSLLSEMEEYVKDNGLSSMVKINKTTNDFKSELKSSDLLLLTSRFEGFVLVKGEAASLSRPCISSNWGDTVYEMFHLGEDGFIVDSENPKDFAKKIEEVFSSKENLIRMKQKAYEYSKELSHEKILPVWEKILG